MSDERLTAILAKRVMGWNATANRFLMTNRAWLPRWRFQPTEKLADAFWLLEQAAPDEYRIHRDDHGNFSVCVKICGASGEAHGLSKPRVITCAVARALGIGADL